ncbi:MAG: hypothetical protein M1831_001442 [Alyxoria varia]|nr:MAG: hypothetical protein M1831_001442 [Alyxoria varia]
MSYSNSLTWTSDKAAKQKSWRSLSHKLNRMYKNKQTPVPWTLNEYLAHLTSQVDHRCAVEARRLENKERLERERSVQFSIYNPEHKPLWLQAKLDSITGPAGKGFFFYEDTIWCLNPPPERCLDLLWPRQKELKHEGDERAVKSFGRFFPCLRQWTKDNYYAKFEDVEILPFLPFDMVDRVPDAYDVYLGADEVEEKDGVHMLGKGLLESMDDDLNFN